ncbi:hypothetical protein MMC15_008047 [Xylographa vitiligo]|nr:hypothetical protein [Xylographa vitiligo]
MIVNRAFQGSSYNTGILPQFPGSSVTSSEDGSLIATAPTLLGYQSIGGARLTLDNYHPLSDALPTVMEIDIPSNATGEVGFLNLGWWGFDVSPQTYTASMYLLGASGVRQNYGNLTGINVSLRSNATGEVWATTKIPVSGGLSDFDYTYLSSALVNTVFAPDVNNVFAVTFDAAEVNGSTFYFDLISLFPETFKNRPNGLRKDLAQAVYDLKPTFLRFPGGNNIEGNSISDRWIWNNTIGDESETGVWFERIEQLNYADLGQGYYNTNGLGLLEFLQWTEDMSLEPLLAIYSGLSLDIFGYPGGTSYPENRMGDVVQYALDELEYCMGNTSTYWGARRASDGHPEPFQINYIELGNEDWFSGTYPYRFPILYNGLKAAYPNITLISTAYNESFSQGYNWTIDLPEGSMWDTHNYQEPSFFLEEFNNFDNWQEQTNNPNVTILLGEYSVYSVDNPSGIVNYSNPASEHVPYPRLLSAIAESVYLLGAERNPNTVKMSSYAPSFANLNAPNWTPNLVDFTASPLNTTKSVSWYSQSLLAHYRGTETLPVTNTQGDFNPLWWVATIDTPSNAIYLKVINSGNNTVPLMVDLDTNYTGVNGTILTNLNLDGSNYINNETAIVPVPISTLPSPSSSNTQMLSWGVPPYSISVLQFDL